MIRGAADVSENWKYLSIIIGHLDDLKGIHKRIGFNNIHMRETNKKDKAQIFNNLIIKGDVLVSCFRVNRFEIVKNTMNKLSKKSKQSGGIRRVQNHYNQLLRHAIEKTYETFLNEHRLTLDSVVFECDADMRRTFTHVGIRPLEPHIVHQLADIIAYYNGKDNRVAGVRERDITEQLEVQLKRKCGIS